MDGRLLIEPEPCTSRNSFVLHDSSRRTFSHLLTAPLGFWDAPHRDRGFRTLRGHGPTPFIIPLPPSVAFPAIDVP